MWTYLLQIFVQQEYSVFKTSPINAFGVQGVFSVQWRRRNIVADHGLGAHRVHLVPHGDLNNNNVRSILLIPIHLKCNLPLSTLIEALEYGTRSPEQRRLVLRQILYNPRVNPYSP